MPVKVQLRRDAGKVGPRTGPWIRARQIGKWTGIADPSKLAEVVDKKGQTLGWGLVSEASSIPVRVLSWGESAPAGDWLATRVAAAVSAREHQGWDRCDTTGVRMINSEGDGLPGLVVDRYHDRLVAQITTAPMAVRQEEIVELLRPLGPVHVVRPEAAAKAEGFEPGVDLADDEPWLRFSEHGLRLHVPAPPSQKTGAYFDQRANRRRVAELAAGGPGPLLDLGCHVGGFALHAAAAGVPGVGVDQSAAMLERAQAHAAENALADLQWVRADMFGPLDDPALAGPFGTIVVDPPKIAARRRDVDRAAAAMQKMVARVAVRLSVGGHLVLCSCSHHLGRDALDRCALQLVGAWVRVAELGADIDHPIAPGHVEGEYLRVAVYQRRA